MIYYTDNNNSHLSADGDLFKHMHMRTPAVTAISTAATRTTTHGMTTRSRSFWAMDPASCGQLAGDGCSDKSVDESVVNAVGGRVCVLTVVVGVVDITSGGTSSVSNN